MSSDLLKILDSSTNLELLASSLPIWLNLTGNETLLYMNFFSQTLDGSIFIAKHIYANLIQRFITSRWK